MDVVRYRLIVEYEGTSFVGWQRQANGPSIQAALEEAIYKFSGEKVRVEGSGRTDAGVHALGQVAHFDLDKSVPGNRIQKALNFHLRPRPITVLRAEPVNPDFHARFSAVGRVYCYWILNRVAPPTLLAHRVWWVPVPLDIAPMRQGAAYLVGYHDFTSFRAQECQAASPLKTVERIEIFRAAEDPDLIKIQVEARSFLHHQVRNFVGTLKKVGEGKWTPEDVRRAREAKDRAAAGPTAPAQGLYFVRALYTPRLSNSGGVTHRDSGSVTY